MRRIEGAGGSQGGAGRFFIGLIMMIAGGYIFLNSISVTQQFGFGRALYSFQGVNITTGMTLFPFIFGIGMIFYNSRNPIGWFLAIASLVMIFFGVISSLQFHMRRMTVFELISILVLMVGGIGLFLSSLRNYSDR